MEARGMEARGMKARGMEAQGMEAQGMEAQGSPRRRKISVGQCCQELRNLITLQEQGLVFSQSCEEKLREKSEQLPGLREALKEDTSVLNFVLKYNRLPTKDVFADGQPVVGATESLEVAKKKLKAKIHEQVKKCDMLLHQVKQWSQARDQRQRYLQQLQDAEMDDKWQEPQLQVIRQLGNDIEKMVMKIQTGQIVTNLYLQAQDTLKKELACLPHYQDLLSVMTVMCQEELTVWDNFKAAEVVKKLMDKAGPQVHMEKSLREQELAKQRQHIETLQLKVENEKLLREQFASMLSADEDRSSSGMSMDVSAEAIEKLEHEARVTEKMEKAKTALQCSSLRDIPGSILAQRKSLEDLDQYIKECEEDEQTLLQTLKELELKRAKLKFHQPLNTTRLREEELRVTLQREEARLEQLQAQMKRNEEQLIEFGNSIDNLFVHLHRVTIPGQEEPDKSMGLEEKLQHCEKKLKYLKQCMNNLPADAHLSDEHNKVLVKVRELLEKKTAEEMQNLKISFEDEDVVVKDSLAFEEEEEEEDHDYVPSRADIKKQGQQLIRINKAEDHWH